jgi:hypothetical protein
MDFDGVVSKEGVGAGVWIVPPNGTSKIWSFKLAFDCTNNVVEYETLILGLNSLKELKAKRVDVHVDFELVINQVKGIYQTKHLKMRAYRNEVMELLEGFTDYYVSLIPRGKNMIFYALATSSSVFKIPIHSNKKYEIEVKHRPSVPINIKYWKVFEDDRKVIRFLQNSDEFSNTQINEENLFVEEENASLTPNSQDYHNVIDGKEIIQLKNNCIPKGLVPLENIFYNNDVEKNPKVTPNEGEADDCNIGIEKEPRFIKLSKNLTPGNKERYLKLMKDFSDVFAWSYEDLKVYDTSIIQHTISIKEDQNPFKQKLRRINPLLFPLIENKVKKLFDANIIVSLRFSKWLENMVPSRKKNGEIRLCVDFRNLNKVSLKENDPLPKMGYIF